MYSKLQGKDGKNFQIIYVWFQNTEKNKTSEESPKQQIYKCCRLGLIEPVHGWLW